MAELSETRMREIVRDELSIMQLPRRLASIEATLEHKADKADVESLKGEMIALDERLTGKIEALAVEQKPTRDFLKYNSRIMIGFFISILTLLIGLIAGVVTFVIKSTP